MEVTRRNVRAALLDHSIRKLSVYTESTINEEMRACSYSSDGNPPSPAAPDAEETPPSLLVAPGLSFV